MLGLVTLVLALATQIGFLIYRLVTQQRQTRLQHLLRIGAFAAFSILLVAGVYWWGFRWVGLFALLAIMAAISAVSMIRSHQNKVEKPFKSLSAVLSAVGGCLLLVACILPGILFPQFQPIQPTGSYEVSTQSITYVDDSRVDPFSTKGESRKLTVQFWYPADAKADESFPLVVFSHGSFGYRGSNRSTFENLASNGYVVCSVDHSSHSFFAKHTDGTTTFVDTSFLNDVLMATNDELDAQTTYQKSREWLGLRCDDMNFILDEVLQNEGSKIPQSLYSLLDTSKVGLFGHSLGGATAAQLGRERTDVDAVIVIDGTMLGEEVGFEDGRPVLNQQAYPVPLLNLYNESHSADAQQLGTAYDNLSASAKAEEAYDVMVKGSGHLNFTDLPLFSPALAHLLGTGSVDSRTCIETMNQITLDFFNHTLKGVANLHLKPVY